MAVRSVTKGILKAPEHRDGAEERAESLATIVAQARRIADVVKRLQQVVSPTSVEYLGSQRMLDIRAQPPAPKDG